MYKGYLNCPECGTELIFTNPRPIPEKGILVACPHVEKCGKLKRNEKGNLYWSQYIFKVIP